MKRLFMLFCIICIGLPVFSGQAQQQYEKQNIIGLLVKSQYNNLLYLYNNRDEADAPALEAIKKNFDNCKTLSCWKYVEVDDYTYKFLNDDVKNMILYNNSVYKNK